MTTAAPLDPLFDHAPISLWLEDFSGIHRLFAQWKADGIEDIDAHFAANPSAVEECSAAIRVLAANQRTLQLLGAQDFGHLVANLGTVFRDDMHDQHAHDMAALWRGGNGFASQSVNYALDGRRIDVLVNARVVPGHEHDWSRVIIALEDITARVQAEQRVKHSEQYALGLFEHSPVSLWVEDFSGIRRMIEDVRGMGIQDFRTFLNVHPEFVTHCMHEIHVIDINRQTMKMFGASNKETILGNLGKIFRDDMHQHFAEQLIDLWNGQLFQQREAINYSLSGQVVNVHLQFSVLPGFEQTWERVLISLTDITARKKAEAYLEFLGRHDPLTKLNNRAYFDEELARVTRKGPYPVSVIIVDLNGLKIANDTIGHAAGDDLLRRAGEALKKAIGDNECVARIGGDEFGILLPGANADDAEKAIERIHIVADLNNQFYTGPRLSFAVGTSTCEDAGALIQAVQRADEAMYAAKRAHYQQHGNDRRHHPASD
ncbi:sensor domain-containing diguanylate cyclase [Uliginosibacterium sp. H1]|uniref:sensor domain-containing diguanylate cyclase n=1 Tax=Uliginosibacterium sp. H1 TaxID=3114757 RepID=UPI002E190252|nr:sensor domain-containing diguanylate cyclase [Uliginosibacterium sp. H1]